MASRAGTLVPDRPTAREQARADVRFPGMRFGVARQFRARVASAFREERINVFAGLDASRATGDAP